MIFENPILHHLGQVLGYRYTPKLPTRLSNRDENSPAEFSSAAALHLITDEEPSQEVHQLLNKMMEAIGCTDFRVLSPRTNLKDLAQASVLFVFGENLLSEEIKEELAQKTRLLESSSLSFIVSGTNPQKVIEIKQQIWQDLKKAQFFLNQLHPLTKR